MQYSSNQHTFAKRFLTTCKRRIFRGSIICTGLLLLSACGKSDNKENEAPPVRYVKTITVSDNTGIEWREFPGEVAAAQKADLGFRISGKLAKFNVSEGDKVKKGQILAELDITDIQIQLQKAEAEYDTMHADFERGKILVEKGVISRSDFDKLSSQNATAKANLLTTQQNLDYAYLKAPFAGQIAKRWVENYEEVSAMQNIVTLQDLSAVHIEVDVPESVMIRVKENAAPNVVARFEAIPNREFPLTLAEISTQADEQTNTFEVTFEMENIADYNILPGMSATVRGERRITQPVDSNIKYIPAQAVIDDGEQRYVYIAKPSGEEYALIEKRQVSTGQLSGLGLEITSGVNSGDHVVIAGMSKMSEGLKVRLMR